MTARILDGKSLARAIQAEIAEEVADFIQNNGVVPRLAAVLMGDDAASEVYIRNKQRACERVGMESELHRPPHDTSTDELLAVVTRLNGDQQVHGILVQLPLPPQVDTPRILRAVDPHKDVDAFHPENVGLLVQGRPRFIPCTPHGIQQLLLRNEIEIAGRRVVVLGRSDIVGKPTALLLMQRGKGGDATVTVCHSRSRDLAQVAREAEILIAAVGRPRFVTAEMVRPGAVVVDVGVHRVEGQLTGDVDFDAAAEVASAITPVPGGVGPLTVSMLLHSTLRAAQLQVP